LIEPSVGTGTATIDKVAAGAPIDQNYVVHRIRLDSGEGTTISDLQIYSQLTTGSFLVRPSGGATPQWFPPNSPSNPAEEFSSFLAAGGGAGAPSPTIVGASQNLGSPNSGGGIVFNSTTLDARWGPALGQGTANLNDWLAAQVAPSKDASGFFRFRAVFSGTLGDTVREFNLPIENGVIGVPEPTGLALIVTTVIFPIHFRFRRRRPRTADQPN
jgi:hypothetical protein